VPPEGDVVDPDFLPEAVDLDRPNIARIYDWALGGTANWAIDRQYGEQAVQAFPLAKTLARSNRDFLGRAVRYCLSEGITQFLDLGSGIPTAGNVHEVADDHCVPYLAMQYLRGETLIESYWKSVAWPGQGVFVGDPLAAPYRLRR